MFGAAWTNLEVVASDEALQDANAMWEWKESHEQFVSAAEASEDNPEREVYLFWQDGPWAVMLDESYTRASDEEALKHLSKEIGTVLSFVIETTGGSVSFYCFQDAQMRRSIHHSDGEVTAEGQPLPEEGSIDTQGFYVDEIEALWRAFGISAYDEMPTSEGCQAICVIDHTDYGDD